MLMTKEPETKSQLAKLLATENIDIRQSPSAKTASFDVKNRVLVLPVWKGISDDLRDMLIVHEVGHALDTPCEGWLDTIKNIAKKLHGDDAKKYSSAIKSFMNVIEDARIDKRQKRRYPGSRRNYLIGYKELIGRDFFGTSKKDINTMSFIDRLNIYYKGGSIHSNISFSPEERVFVNRVGETETFEQVMDLTEEIYAWAKAQGEKQKESEKESEKDSMSNDSDEGTTEAEDDFYEEDAESDASEEEPDTEETSSEDDDDGEESGEDTKNLFDPDADEKDDEFVPNSETDTAWEENQSTILSNSDVNYIYVDLPIPNYENIIDDYKKVLAQHAIEFSKKELSFQINIADMIKRIMSDENPAVSYMAKEFEMRKSADIYSRISIAKTGTIDTNKLHSYKYNEDIFRKLSVVPQGKNHGFVIFLDWSGSMTVNLRYTIKQLMSLTMFCKRVQIPFEVYLFRDRTYAERYDGQSFTPKSGAHDVFSNFKLRNILSSRMNTVELNSAYKYLWSMTMGYCALDPMQSTPLNQTIYVADKIVNDFRVKNKVQIVNTVFLTDGDSDPIRYSSQVTSESYRKGSKIIIQDTKTKKEYMLSGNGIYDNYRAVTTTLLDMLKERTKSNLVGFFLCPLKYNKMKGRFFPDLQNAKYEADISSSWKNDRFVNVPNEGYDEYYVINTTKRDDSDAELNVNSSMTRSKIAKEFQKFSERKSVNRILINRFMKKIAGNSK